YFMPSFKPCDGSLSLARSPQIQRLVSYIQEPMTVPNWPLGPDNVQLTIPMGEVLCWRIRGLCLYEDTEGFLSRLLPQHRIVDLSFARLGVDENDDDGHEGFTVGAGHEVGPVFEGLRRCAHLKALILRDNY